MDSSAYHIDFNFERKLISQGNELKSPDFFFISKKEPCMAIHIKDTPFYTFNSCCICILKGTATYIVNLNTIQVRPHDVLLVPSKAIVEIKSISADLDIQICSLGQLYLYNVPILKNIPENGIWERMQTFFDLFKAFVDEGDSDSATSIQRLILHDLKKVHAKTLLPKQSENKHLEQFLLLLHHYGSRKRDVSFYANKMSVTPNWLSNIVKAESGETVLRWIMLALIQNAKVHLGYTDKPVYAIAETLGFSSDVDFSRVFKRETGMTPIQYRKSLEAV